MTQLSKKEVVHVVDLNKPARTSSVFIWSVRITGLVVALWAGFILGKLSEMSFGDTTSVNKVFSNGGHVDFPPMSSPSSQTTRLVIHEGDTVWGELEAKYLDGERFDSKGDSRERYVLEEIAWLEARLDRDLDLVFPGEVIYYSVPADWAQFGEVVEMPVPKYTPDHMEQPIRDYDGSAVDELEPFDDLGMYNKLCEEPTSDC